MARSYHVDIARHVADSDAKWLDNLLSRFEIPGVAGGRQGQARRLSSDGVVRVALIRRLVLDLGLATADAVIVAGQLLGSAEGTVERSPGLELRLDRPRLEREIERAISDAVETVVPARRGRPPGRRVCPG